MTLLSTVSDCWLGLCQKPPTVQAHKTGIGIPTELVYVGQPDGGGGGSGTIHWGIGAALSGMRTLNRNRQLLWFTLLAGLVFAGNILGQAAFWYTGCNLHMQFDWIAWQFFIEFATLFCLVFLLAGLFLSIPSERKGSASFFAGLAGAKKYLKAIFLWSFILALTGMLLVFIFSYFPALFPHEIGFLYRNGFGLFDSFLMNTISQFPFNLTLRPDIFTWLPGYGGRSVLLWIYPGFRDALTFMAINLLLFILTPFVVPFIVLGQKTIREAVVGSFALLRKTWVEIASCAIFLGILVSVVFLAYLLVGAAYGMVAPLEIVNYRPTLTWIVLALLYDLALFSVAFVVATVGGIAALDLYVSAKTGQIPGSSEPERHS